MVINKTFMKIHKAQRSEFITDRMSTRYAHLFPYYTFVVSTIGILGHAKEMCRFSAWKESATERGEPTRVPPRLDTDSDVDVSKHFKGIPYYAFVREPHMQHAIDGVQGWKWRLGRETKQA